MPECGSPYTSGRSKGSPGKGESQPLKLGREQGCACVHDLVCRPRRGLVCWWREHSPRGPAADPVLEEGCEQCLSFMA